MLDILSAGVLNRASGVTQSDAPRVNGPKSQKSETLTGIVCSHRTTSDGALPFLLRGSNESHYRTGNRGPERRERRTPAGIEAGPWDIGVTQVPKLAWGCSV